jgi:hypothetical protein
MPAVSSLPALELRRDRYTPSPTKVCPLFRPLNLFVFLFGDWIGSLPGAARVDVAEFLNGVGKRVEKHAAKPEDAVGSDIQRLIEAGKLRRKNRRIPCKRVSHKFSSLLGDK